MALSKNVITSGLGLVVFSAVYTMLVVVEMLVGVTGISYVGVATSFVGGLIFAYFLRWIVSKIEVRRLDLLLILWLTLLMIQYLSNMIEGFFFTTLYSSASYLVVSLVRSAANTFVESIMAVFLFYHGKGKTEFFPVFSGFFKRRGSTSWLWRIVACSLAYFPVYFLFGVLITPFIMPYYAGSPTLRIPSFTVIIPLELFRGFLYTVTLLLLVPLATTRKNLFVMLASTLYIPGAFLNLIVPSTLPANILPFHLLEILGDSIVYGFVIARLLGRPH